MSLESGVWENESLCISVCIYMLHICANICLQEMYTMETCIQKLGITFKTVGNTWTPVSYQTMRIGTDAHSIHVHLVHQLIHEKWLGGDHKMIWVQGNFSDFAKTSDGMLFSLRRVSDFTIIHLV